jgi:hypothetical protein
MKKCQCKDKATKESDSAISSTLAIQRLAIGTPKDISTLITLSNKGFQQLPIGKLNLLKAFEPTITILRFTIDHS